MRRVYETTIIVNAALEDNDVESVINKVTAYIENHGGTIQEVERWGRKRLAYPINKKYNGFYVHIIFDANSNTIPILERFMVLEDTVLRHLTLVLPAKLREFRIKKAIEIAQREADKIAAEKEANNPTTTVEEKSN
jgi:small subunit ribosomal protein S6